MAAKPKKKTRRHTAKAQVQILELSKAGTSIDIEVHADGKKVGSLVIGRGSVTWYGHKWQYGRAFTWSAFAKWMDK